MSRGKANRLSLLLLLVVSAVSGWAGEGWASERILNYITIVRVLPDASMEVGERITFNVENQNIKRGIVRVFPVRYKTETGRSHKTGFEVAEVKLDGKPIPHSLSWPGDNVEVKIGDPNKIIEPGKRTFTIVYRVTGHIRDLEDRDALYWNVTGNDWEFPIDMASCRVFLPKGAKILADNAYTGLRGESGSDFRRDDAGRFITTKKLSLHAGFTVAVDWEKGLITYPPFIQTTFFSEELRWIGIIGIPLLALLFYLTAWTIWGRDPKLGVIVPIFYPPEGMEPGYMAMLRDRNLEVIPLCFTADVLELAVQGYLRIKVEGKDEISFIHTGKESKNLSEPFRAILNTLFSKMHPIVKSTEKVSLSLVWDKLEAVYQQRGKLLNRRNILPSCLAGLLLAASSLFLTLLIPGPPDNDAQPPGIWTVACMWVPLCWGGWHYFCKLFTRRFVTAGLRQRILMLMYMCAEGGFGLLALIYSMYSDPSLTGGFLAAFLITLYFSVYLMPVKSVKAVSELTQVEGLAMYIGTAERDRLAVLNAPEDSPEVFERLLPYAVALDCAEAWSKRFAPLIERIDYSPDWCEADERDWRRKWRSDRLAAAITGAAEKAIAYDNFSGSGSNSSWSSGTSGGSSGGGSGGGGGRGW